MKCKYINDHDVCLNMYEFNLRKIYRFILAMIQYFHAVGSHPNRKAGNKSVYNFLQGSEINAVIG